jgi:hypothetical protein
MKRYALLLVVLVMLTGAMIGFSALRPVAPSTVPPPVVRPAVAAPVAMTPIVAPPPA